MHVPMYSEHDNNVERNVLSRHITFDHPKVISNCNRFIATLRMWRFPSIQLVELWLIMQDVPGSNPIGYFAFFADKICSTVTLAPN